MAGYMPARYAVNYGDDFCNDTHTQACNYTAVEDAPDLMIGFLAIIGGGVLVMSTLVGIAIAIRIIKGQRIIPKL